MICAQVLGGTGFVVDGEAEPIHCGCGTHQVTTRSEQLVFVGIAGEI